MKKLHYLLLIVLTIMLNSLYVRSQIILETELQKIKQTDKEWLEVCKSKDVKKMVDFYDDYAKIGEKLDITGKEAITKLWTYFFGLEDYYLTWQTEDAFVSTSGDFGYTISKWEQGYTDKNGNPKESTGVSLTILKKQKDGSWKALIEKP